MASGQSSAKLQQELLIVQYDHDPDSASATLLAPDAGVTPVAIDMSLYTKVLFEAAIRTGTSASITKLEIVASESSAMTSLEVIKDSGAIVINDPDDYAILECTAEEVGDVGARAGKNLRYISARLTQAGNADNEASVVLIAVPRFPRSALSATKAD